MQSSRHLSLAAAATTKHSQQRGEQGGDEADDAADGDFGDQSSALRLAMLLVGGVAAIVGIGCIARRARARLDEHLDALDPLDGDGEEEEEAHAATPLQRKELGPQP